MFARRNILAAAIGLIAAATTKVVEAAGPGAAPRPAKGAGKAPRLKRIDNMDIYTGNVPRLVDFYTKTLGLSFFLPYEPEKEWAAIEFGNLTLYVFKADKGVHEPRRDAQYRRPGIDAFAFEVDNLDEAMKALEGKVEWLTAEPVKWEHPSGTHYRYRSFYDPDGNKMYVTEPHKVAARPA